MRIPSFLRRPAYAIASLFLLIALLWAFFPFLFTSYDPTVGTSQGLLAPSAEHFFGTDAVGRDVFSRVVWGTRQSLFGALLAILVGIVFGSLIGVIAGTVHGGKFSWVDSVLMRIVDVFLSIPALLLALSIIIVLGFGTINAAIAVGITSIATFARLSRSQVLGVARSEYVEAAYGSGATFFQVLFRHILPNSLNAVLALAALQFGSAILQLSILGFLGYGAPPPTPEWGLIIADSRDFIATAWWLTVLPGVVIIAVVLSANTLSKIFDGSSR